MKQAKSYWNQPDWLYCIHGVMEYFLNLFLRNKTENDLSHLCWLLESSFFRVESPVFQEIHVSNLATAAYNSAWVALILLFFFPLSSSVYFRDSKKSHGTKHGEKSWHGKVNFFSQKFMPSLSRQGKNLETFHIIWGMFILAQNAINWPTWNSLTH